MTSSALRRCSLAGRPRLSRRRQLDRAVQAVTCRAWNGAEPLLVIRELERHGEQVVEADLAALPSLRELDVADGYAVWTISVPGSVAEADIRECFDFVPPDAIVDVTRQIAPPVAVPPPASAVAQHGQHQHKLDRASGERTFAQVDHGRRRSILCLAPRRCWKEQQADEQGPEKRASYESSSTRLAIMDAGRSGGRVTRRRACH